MRIKILAIVLIFLAGMIYFFEFNILGKVIYSGSGEILGYCPTMKSEAEEFAKEKNLELKEFSSASVVLKKLNSREIDYALIGRKAKKSEFNSKEIILEGGYTLVSKEKSFINYTDLIKVPIQTYIKKESAKEFIEGGNFIFYNSLEEIDLNGIVLIDWRDWKDYFELVVVMNGTEKVKDFRGVFLYEN